MKRRQVTLLTVGLCLGLGTAASAQMGMELFRRPAIASLLKPVVGSGGVYETAASDAPGAPKSTIEFLVVGKEMADGKDAFWLEVGHQMKGAGGLVYSKVLISTDDFQLHRSIMQIPGHPAMEMKVTPSPNTAQRTEDDLSKWIQVGTEAVTVPAGTFSCQHWKKSDAKDEIWASDKISPFGIVKEVKPNSTQVLVKVLTDTKDHITGPVSPFDPQAFRQMMMDQMMQQRPQNP
jgi:hypothetical protein